MISVTEDRCEDGKRSGVVENGAESDGRRLDRWEVCKLVLNECWYKVNHSWRLDEGMLEG